MKKFIVSILLLLMLCVPMFAQAVDSPTAKTKITCDPEMPFTVLDGLLQDINVEGYIPVEILSITLEHEYELVRWTLLVKFEVGANVKVMLLAEDGTLTMLPVMTTVEGDLLVDFYDIKPGDYILYFLISKE